MLDPSGMYPKGFHPVRIDRSRDFKGKPPRYNRTQRPPRYYFIYSSLSRQYHTRNALHEPPLGGDKFAPEHRPRGRRCNPFRTDIYHLGILVRERFIEVILLRLVCFVAYQTFQEYNGFEFMEDLVIPMTYEDPVRRPTIEEVIGIFSRIRESLNAAKLRSPIISRGDSSVITAFSQAIHTVRHMTSQKPAIPLPVAVPITDNRTCLSEGIYFIVEVECYDN